MVAPFDIGDPARSFVRIPGSGSDPSLKSVCFDLSRGASAAASAPIPQNIPHLPLAYGPAAPTLKNEGQENSGIKIPPHQLPSVERQLHTQITLNGNVATMNNNSQETQSDKMTSRKLPLLKENNKFIIHRRKFPQPQIILPSKVIKIKTGKTASQALPPRTRFNITTIKKRVIRQPTINTIKKAVNRSPQQSLNFSQGIPNSQHPRGSPEIEQDGKLLQQQKRIQQHRLFQEIFKDKRRLTALLKRLNVIH